MSTPLPHWRHTTLTPSSLPLLEGSETQITYHGNIGLYQGTAKILNCQHGRVYLTNKRLIYVDDTNPKDNSFELSLGDVKWVECQRGIFRSSPKITLYLKTKKANTKGKTDDVMEWNGTGDQSMTMTRTRTTSTSTTTTTTTTWNCPVCSFPNEININFNYQDESKLPVCTTCGVKSTREIIESTIKESLIAQPTPIHPPITTTTTTTTTGTKDQAAKPKNNKQTCTKCTFLNHPSLRNCELCGSLLPITLKNTKSLNLELSFESDKVKLNLEGDDGLTHMGLKYIKLSFRSPKQGSERTFFNILEETLEKYQWELLDQNGNVNKNSKPVVDPNSGSSRTTRSPPSPPSTPVFGIHSLTIKETKKSQQNQHLLTTSVDDFPQLLNKANELVTLLNSFSSITKHKHKPHLNQSALTYQSRLSTDDVTHPDELARQLSTYLTTAVATQSTQIQIQPIIPLSDLYLNFNLTRLPSTKISPSQLLSALPHLPRYSNWKSITLPGNLQVITHSNPAYLTTSIVNYISSYGIEDAYGFKKAGVLEVAGFFGWGLSVAEHILGLSVKEGACVVDGGVSGVSYYCNLFKQFEDQEGDKDCMEDVMEDVIDDGQNDAVIGIDEKKKKKETNLFDLDFPTVPHQKPLRNEDEEEEEQQQQQQQQQETVSVNNEGLKSKNMKELEGLIFS